MFDLSTMFFFPIIVLCFLGGVLGEIRFPLECSYLLGQNES
jgi:hypothetical protein